ncbi:MAG: hypothetical protein ACTH2U_12130 [Brevibacterium sp.]
MAGAVGKENVDVEVMANSSLSRVDYVDHFTVNHQVKISAIAEEWARAMFGDAPDLIEKLLWSGILGLRLHKGKSAETIAGWSITARGYDWIRMSAASRNASAELIVHVTDEVLGLATIVRYDRKHAPAVWVPVAFVHRRLVPVLLRTTVRSQLGEPR